MGVKKNIYTAEQDEFLRINAPLMSRKELTERFNAKFGTNRSWQGIKLHCNRNGWNSSEDGRFKVGNAPWTTGLDKEELKSHFTEESYQRRSKIMKVRNQRTKKIGDEMIMDGFPWVVSSLEPDTPFYKRRKSKRRWVWEQLYGEIPKDHCIVCLDGDPMNCDPSNLYCMPKRYSTMLTQNNWWFKSPELILTAIKWCELFCTLKDTRIGE